MIQVVLQRHQYTPTRLTTRGCLFLYTTLITVVVGIAYWTAAACLASRVWCNIGRQKRQRQQLPFIIPRGDKNGAALPSCLVLIHQECSRKDARLAKRRETSASSLHGEGRRSR
jgi:hypothetical protein